MRLAKSLAWGAAFFFFIYILYVVGVVVFLNTPLFSRLAAMEDEAQTYVRFKGAFSLFPGHLYVPSGRVFIGDQNVSIGIDIKSVRARFRLKPLLNKRLEVTSIDIERAEVDVGLKNERESDAYAKKYTEPESLDLKKRIQLSEERAKSRLTLDFKSIVIRKIANVRGGFGALDGEMALQGGFLIQPKVQVEVYPTTLRFLSGIVGRADVRIERFRTVDAPGNAVFPYVNADFNFKVNAQSLRRFGLQLESLPGYALDHLGSDGRVNVKIVKGILQKGSSVESVNSRMIVHTPTLRSEGIGSLKWEVDAEASSRLRADLRQVQLQEKRTKITNKGSVRSARLDIRLYGIRLVSAFNGLSMLLRIRGLEWKLKSDFDRNTNFAYEGRMTGNGVIGGFSGDVPESIKRVTNRSTQLTLDIPQIFFRTSFAKEVKGLGRVVLNAGPLDLASPNSLFPDVRSDFELRVGRHGVIRSQAVFTQLEHQSTPLDSWKAKLHWTLDKTEPLIEAVDEQTELSGIVQSLAKVKDLKLDAECELTETGSVIRFTQIQSNGPWKGYGTLRNGPDGMNGLFELTMFSMPIGVWIRPESTEVQFMPNQEWYDRTLESTKVTTAQDPRESGARGKR